jgi:nucleoside-diphosphate-sugar epimerase
MSGRVLVTGAGGFAGRQTLAPLLAAGLEVHAVSSKRATADEGVPADVHWHHVDLLDRDATGSLVQRVRPSRLLHLAWCVEPVLCLTASVNLDWVGASLALLRAFTEAGGERAVMAGSCAEYSWAPWTHCIEERTATAPATLYGAAKHGLHVVAAAWAAQVEVELAWARIFHLYGPHEHVDRLVGAVARALIRGEQVATSDGRQVFDYLYVEDLGVALVALLDSEVTGAVNVASGTAVAVADVIGAVAEAAGHPELVRLGALPTRPGEPHRLTADVRRLREDVGWEPSTGLREGAQRTVEWWRRAAA